MSDEIRSPDHYVGRGGIEPIELMTSLWVDNLKANVLKYVYRYQQKGMPVRDLRKALQYLAWAIQAESMPKPPVTVKEFIESNGFDVLEEQCITALCSGELRAAEGCLRDLLRREYAKEKAKEQSIQV